MTAHSKIERVLGEPHLTDLDARRLLRARVLTNAMQRERDWRESGTEADDLIDKLLSDWQADAGRLPLPGRYSDSPETSDELGFDEWVNSLTNLLTDELLRTPVGVCLDGDWGVGKSTFMRMLHTQLTRDRFTNSGWLVLWIDSSLFMSGEQVLPFVATMLLREAKSRATGCLGQNSACARPPSLPWPSYLWGDQDQLPSEDDKKGLTKRIRAWLEAWEQAEENDEWDFGRFQALVRDVRHGVLGGHGLERIVLMVDDLDRCEPDVIWSVFSLHRVLLQETGLIFLYAMDVARIAEAVGVRLSMTGRHSLLLSQRGTSVTTLERGERFLEKFFTHKLRPPQPNPATLDKWFTKMIGPQHKPSGFGEVLYWGLCGNPRMVKFVANICGSLLDHLRTSPTGDAVDSLWDRLTTSLGEEQTMKLLCKTVAFAYGWPPAFESIRGRAARFRAAEAAARTNLAIPCVWGYDRWLAQVDRGLHVLLTSKPFYPPDEDLCADLIDAVDPYLPQSWAMHRHLGVALTPTEDSGIIQPGDTEQQGKAIVASPLDVNRTEEMVARWRNKREFPHDLRTQLELTPPPVVADLFRKRNFDPSSRAMLDRANEIGGNDPSAAQYLVAAALAKPEIDIDDYLVALRVSAKVAPASFSLSVYELGISMFPDSQTLHLGYFGSLLATTALPENMDKAMSMFCDALHVERESLAEGEFDPSSEGTRGWLGMLFDNAENAGLMDEALDVARAAGRQSKGKSPFVYRNLAKLLTVGGDNEMGARIHLASLFMEPKDDQTAAWLASGLSRVDWGKPNRCDAAIVAAARDLLDANHAHLAGELLVADGAPEEALPFFKHTLALAPDSERARESLVYCYRQIEKHDAAAEASEKVFVPGREDETLKIKGREALLRLLEVAKGIGRVEYDGLILFDPDDLPPWLTEETLDSNSNGHADPGETQAGDRSEQ